MRSLKKYSCYNTTSEHRNISVKQFINFYLPLFFLSLIVFISFIINIPSLYADTATQIWPCFRHDPQHTGRSPYVGPQTHNLRWQIGSAQNVVTSSPAIGADGTIYIGYSNLNLNVSALYALENDPDPNQKVKVKWSYTTGGIIISTPAIGEDGTIYFGCADQNIYALNQDGTKKWIYPTGGEVHSSPVIGPNGTIYMGSSNGHLYAINPDGTLKQDYPTETSEEITSSPAIGKDGTIFFGSHDGSAYLIDPNGTLIKAPPAGAAILSSIAIGSDGAIYVPCNDHNVYSIDSEGNPRTYVLGGEIISSPAIDVDGTVYIGCMDGKVYAIDPKDQGDGIKWTYETGGEVWSSPAIGADGTIYIGSHDKNVYALTPSGEVKWSYETNGTVRTSPAIGADGTLYIASTDGRVYAFKSEQPPCYFTAEITATGQSITGLEDNISAVSIGIAPDALVEEAPPTPPDNTVVLFLTGDPNDSVYDLKKDIRAAKTDPNEWQQEEWQLNVSVGGPGTVADPNKPGYFPVLSWNPEDFCNYPNTGFFRLCTKNDKGKLIPFVSDMTKVGQYQTKREDGDCAGQICVFTYYIIWSDKAEVEMNFLAGWSMMSLPLDEIDNPTPKELFPEAAVIYAYDKLYGYIRIEDDDEMQFGTGYWILFYEDQNYMIRGYEKNFYSITVNEPGWRMIGGCTHEARPTADSCEIGVIYRYIKKSGYKRISDLEALIPGEGFWILLKEVAGQCQINVVTTGALSRSRACYVND